MNLGLLLGAGAVGFLAYQLLGLGSAHAATSGSVLLRAGVPYRFTYQTHLPLIAMTSGGNTREAQVRLLLAPASAYAIEFTHRPGLVGGEYLVSFNAAPPSDVTATIGAPLKATPAEAFDLRLVRVERVDGKAL